MATIDDIQAVERLMQTLDENPHLMEAVRSRILTRELLELPQLFTRLTERVEQVEGQLARLTERVEQVEGQLARLTERVEQVEGQLARLTERVDRIEGQLTQLIDQVQKLTDSVFELADRTDRRFNRIADDLTWLKDVGVATIADKQAMSIAEDLGLEYERQLTQIEVRDLVRNQDTADIAPGDLRSFRAADMIIEATDAAGQLHYVAVEVSFTADQRDIDRPIRNAGYLTRFTGKPAHAVVASVRTDRRIDDIISSGQIHWHQLRERSAQRE